MTALKAGLKGDWGDEEDEEDEGHAPDAAEEEEDESTDDSSEEEEEEEEEEEGRAELGACGRRRDRRSAGEAEGEDEGGV